MKQNEEHPRAEVDVEKLVEDDSFNGNEAMQKHIKDYLSKQGYPRVEVNVNTLAYKFVESKFKNPDDAYPFSLYSTGLKEGFIAGYNQALQSNDKELNELRRWKAEQIAVFSPLLDYGQNEMNLPVGSSLVGEILKRLKSNHPRVEVKKLPEKIVPLKAFLGMPLELKTGYAYYEKDIIDAAAKFESQFNETRAEVKEEALKVLTATIKAHTGKELGDSYNMCGGTTLTQLIVKAMETYASQVKEEDWRSKYIGVTAQLMRAEVMLEESWKDELQKAYTEIWKTQMYPIETKGKPKADDILKKYFPFLT